MAVSSSTITRFELGATFEEFDLAANRRGYIGPRVFRPRPVGIQAADVGKLPIEALLQTHDTARAPGAGYKRGSFEFEKYSYSTDEHGWEEPMDDRTLAVYRDLIDAEMIHAERAKNFVLQNYEIACAAAAYDTSVWTGAALTTGLTNEWDDHAAATPVADIFAAKQKVIDGAGVEPNALILNAIQLHHAKECADIIDRLKYSGIDDPKEIGAAQLAQLFELDFLIVAGQRGSAAVKNTAGEGQAAALSRIWSSEYMMVAKVAVSDDPREPCIGHTFMFTGDGPGAPGSESELAVIMEEYREDSKRSTIIRARNDRQIKVMYPECGHLISNAITL